MGFWKQWFSAALGIVISFALPVLIRTVRAGPFGGPAGFQVPAWWSFVQPYAMLGLLSLVLGMVLVVLLGNRLTGTASWVAAGYLWDSTLQKALEAWKLE